MRSVHNSNPRVITTDKYAATIATIKNESKKSVYIPKQNYGHPST